MNRTDYQILNLLQADSRTTLKAIGDRVGLTAPAVSERIRRMEDKGVIQSFSIHVDRTLLDCNLTGFLHDISGILAPGQACIITEARHGRKYGANGSAIVVCPGRRIKYLDLGDLSVQCARKMLEGTDCDTLKQESEDRA